MKLKASIRSILFFLFLVGIWWLIVRLHVVDSMMLPGPKDVFDNLLDNLRSGNLLASVAVSLRRVAIGYLISLLVGVPLGILLARVPFLADTVGSLVAGLQALPSICWLPLALLWFGLNDKAILFVVVMGSFVSITVAVQDGVNNLPPSYLRAARTLGASGLALYTQVLLPASLPAILTGAKLGWAYAWRALMAGELLFVSVGLGRMLMVGRELADMSQVLSVMIVIIAIGLFADKVVFGNAEALVREKFGLNTNE
jgi:NitT/TauT family transport system permease protein